MENQEKSFSTICRVCLVHDKPDKMVSLIDASQESGLSIYGSSFEEITKIPVKQNQYLPTNLCEKCKESVEGVCKFLVACVVSDRKLRKLVNFSLEKDLDGAMVKEVLRQYTLFSQNFAEDARSSSNHPSASQIHKHALFSEQQTLRNEGKCPKIGGVEVEQTVNFSSYDNEDCIYLDDKIYENTTQSDIDTVDIFIASIKKLITSQINDLKADKSNKIQNYQNTTMITQRDKEAKEKSFTCKVCQKVLTTEKTYKQHIQRHGVCRFVCDQCGKSFPINAELVQHQIHNHGASSQYECDLCSYRAVKKIQLIEHIRLHTGERPFTCEKCGLTFRRKTLYNKHAKFHGEQTISCDLCPRKFFVRSAMLAHRNSRHNREYSYSCRICNVTYALARTVKKHMLDKHGIPKHLQGKVQKTYKNGNGDADCSVFEKSKGEELSYF